MIDKLTIYNSDFSEAIRELDLGKDQPFQIIFRMSDIRNPSKRGGSHSYTVTLPSTQVNDEFFGGLYDPNAGYEVFNPNFKTYCILTVDSEELLVGYFELKTVKVNDLGEIEYACVFFDNAVSLFSKLNKLKVVGNTDPADDIDFSDLNHVWNKDSIVNSFTGDWLNTGYYYPHLLTNKAIMTVEDFQPAIYEKRLLDKIVSKHGFTWGGSLKEDPNFANVVIPYTGEVPSLTEEVAAARAMTAKRATDVDPFIAVTSSSGYFSTGISPIDLNEEIDPNGLWSEGYKYTAPDDGRFFFEYKFDFRAGIDYFKGIGIVTGKDLNFYGEIKVVARVYNDVGAWQYSTYPILVGTNSIILTGDDYDNTMHYLRQDIDMAEPLNFSVASSFDGVPDADFFELSAGWEVRFFFQFRGFGLRRADGSLYDGSVIDLDGWVANLKTSSFIRCKEKLDALGEWSTPDYSNFINKSMLQMDVFNDIIARYDCYIYQDPTNASNIIFDIGEDFRNSGAVVDWSNIHRREDMDVIKPIAELQDEKLQLTYKPAKDSFNGVYTEATTDVYGEYEYTFANEFVKKKTRVVQTPFEPTPLVRLRRNNTPIGTPYEQSLITSKLVGAPKPIVPSINPSSKVSNLRLLYKGGLINPMNVPASKASFILKYRPTAFGEDYTYYMPQGYPYAGHYDDPVNPTHDLNFGTLQMHMDNFVSVGTANNARNIYWRNSIEQMAKGKLMTSYLELSSANVSQIRQKPNTLVWLKKKYWRVDNIGFEANSKLRKVTKVDLVSAESGISIDTSDSFYRPDAEVEYSDSNFGITPNTGGGIVKTDTDTNGNTVSNATGGITITGSGNIVGSGSTNVSIIGSGNTIGSNTSNTTLTGSNGNTILASNVTIINTDNVVVTTDNTTIIDGVLIIGDESLTLFNIVEGGEDNVYVSGATGSHDLIQTEPDTVYDDAATTLVHVLDGNTNSKINI